MSYGNRKAHFVLVPFFAQGHMIPMIDLARLLMLQGVAVSVVTTPGNIARCKATVDRANAAGLPIRFIELRFPCAEVGLSEGCECFDLVPSPELFKNFHQGEIARELRVPRFVYHSPSCFFLLCIPQSMGFFDHPGYEKLRDEVAEAESTADGLVWAIGPVCLSNKETGDKVTRGNKMNVDENYIRNWLDAKETASVIYVSFGSIASHSASHLIEIGLGLEASKRPFVWVIREKEMRPEVARFLSEGFEERTKGLILRGWAPQVLILSHPSVG
ncbi:unnamed protein product [Musa acuminata subsp. malaccensis]|uniref:(wild Malaysian banana) hypothetical protein n=1 Tax=Musa acuminata subsp. malaccensis TaxID=214687 RepID=A0A804I3Y5_MUSAM|nr:unnamed protein product [Musa acuminata subsp. malaccensis]